MQLRATRRPVRIRRLLTVSAIAAVVVLAPATAADGLVLPVSNAAESTARPAADAKDYAKDDDTKGNDTKDDDAKGRDGAGAAAPEVPPGGKDGKNNGLDVIGRDCSKSDLEPHDGFQKSPACVSTQMGEVAGEDNLPSLLITSAPEKVQVNESFQLKVSTRNLVRDRFLGAADGGYYLESSFLNGDGLQRGHFHTACRILSSPEKAPDSSKAPEFFLATQDNKGGAEPDTVAIDVPGIGKPGELQCTSWAGDGSHRTPMMTKANETPAIDSVRITVTD
jgi:hypothetical protein